MRNPVRSLTIMALVLALLSPASCKKTLEGETKRWDSSNATITRLAAEYPSFKAALEEQRRVATQAMDAAKQVGDQEQRIDAMARANTLLGGGFVGQLAAVERSKKEIREKAVDVPSSAKDEGDRLGARSAADAANRIITEVESRLRQGAADPAAATIVMQKVTSELRAAESALDKVARNINSKERAKKEAEKSAAKGAAAGGAAAGDGEAGDKPAKAATWTCEYCDTKNPAKNDVCSECAAKKP